MNHQSLHSAQLAWMDLRDGMFIHFGPNTFTQSGWGDGTFPAEEFCPSQLNTDQWAEVAVEAGMKYAVLTAKHHDGFCLWPTRHTEYCTRQRDVVGKFVKSFRRAGLKVGLYYSLWDRNYPRYDDDGAYADYMFAQLEELLTSYGSILELWFDGGWDKDHPTREWPSDPRFPSTQGERWRWRELYRHIHKLQPDCLVIQNSSSDRPGQVKYPPVDVRTAEHFDFVWQEKLHPVAAGNLPLEYCTSLTPKWFWNDGDGYSHPSVETIVGWRARARAGRANLLLNVGPDKRGLIPDYHRHFLRAAALQ